MKMYLKDLAQLRTIFLMFWQLAQWCWDHKVKGSEKLVKPFYFKFTVAKKDEEQSLYLCDMIGPQRNLVRYENKCTCLWNPDYGKISISESGIQLKESGIQLTIGIRLQVLLTNTGIRYLESGIHSEESRIQDCLSLSCCE